MSQVSSSPSLDADAPVVVAKDLKQVYKISRGLLRKPDALQAVGGGLF